MWKGEYHCSKKNGYCGYAKRNRSEFCMGLKIQHIVV